MDALKASLANSSPLTPLVFLEWAATVYGDCPATIYNDATRTWSETHRRCLCVASSLSMSGLIGKGDVVSVIAPNTPAMYELQFSVPMSGAILNNINTRLDSRTVSILLQHAESKLVFVDYQSISLVINALSMFPSDTPCPRLVLIAEEEGDEFDTTTRNSGGGSEDELMWCTYENLVEAGDPTFEWVRPVSEWDPMVLNYTSGTTSAPKGVVHCHRALFMITLNSLVDWSVPKQAVYLWTLPIFHANGWSYPWGMAAIGGTNICLRKFDASVVYDLIRKHGVTHLCGAPVVLNMLSKSPPLTDPVHIMTAGAPPPAEVLHRTESLGFRVSHGYGLTETAGLVVSCAWKPQWNRLPANERARLKARQGVGTVGFTDVDVVELESGAGVKRDGATVGEIVLRGGCIMLGYLKDPKGTDQCMGRGGGWFYTGDVGVIHPDGYLEIKDRSKDVIISGGENISSIEIESVLYTHPAVNEAAVVARPDEYWGETPCAFITLKPVIGSGCRNSPPTEREMIEFCRTKLPHYMVPKTVVFKEDLPKTSTGKVQKFTLRDLAKGKVVVGVVNGGGICLQLRRRPYRRYSTTSSASISLSSFWRPTPPPFNLLQSITVSVNCL